MVVLVLKVAGACLALLLLAGSAQALHPVFDLISHFRFHLVSGLAIVAVVLLLSRQWRKAVAALFVCAIAALMMGAAILPGAAVPAPDLTLLQFNTRFDNQTPDAILSQVAVIHPDVITLQEVSRTTALILRALQGDYPYQIQCPFAGVGGVAVLSRHPSSGIWCSAGRGLAGLRIEIGGRQVTVASVHLHWPWPYRQAQQVDGLLPLLGKLPQPVIVAGDFNAAGWSNVVRRIADQSRTVPVPGLRLTLKMGPSVLAQMPLLPIDHVLVPEASVAEAHRGGEAGSDHLPVIARITLPR